VADVCHDGHVQQSWWNTRHVPAFPPDLVTSRNVAGETEPRAVGLTQAAVEEMWQSVVHLYQGGLHPAIGLCVRVQGQVVLDRAIGHLRGNTPDDGPDTPRVPIRHDSLFSLFSASKAVTAMLVHLLDERGLVHLDDPVVEYIPEFGPHGKHEITLRQLLTHRAGIPTVPGTAIDERLLGNWDEIIGILCHARPLSKPGRQLAYHALTSGYILGEILRRVTGRDVRSFLADEVLGPLGFEHFNYGVAPELASQVAEHTLTGMPALRPLAGLLERSLGVNLARAVELSNSQAFRTCIVPSGNIIGTANEASRFFQLLLQDGELDGKQIFHRRTVRRALAETSYLEVDSFLGLPVRYGMGFMLGGSTFSPYGHETPNAFGHIGFTEVVAYADPDRSLSVGLMTSGKPFITPGMVRWLAVPRTIARLCPRVRERTRCA
jgi:CubicO group peptidase (beta-lactamase class C family)